MRDLWFDPAESGAKGGDRVVCTTERGTELGVATADAFEVDAAELAETIGDAELKRIDRVADEEDLERADELAVKGSEALPVFKKLAKESGLDMKPVGVEYLFGGERVICYFVADERVDFRQLVRDLSRALHERIDMRQIGVREEASFMGGYAHCGQELCCARLGTGFEPVSIRMAKEQDLPLNSPKISGQCGRLMCCLRYEFEAYKDFKSRAPKRNAQVETPLGEARVVDYNTPKEEVGMRLENGKTMRVPLAGMTCSECAKKRAEENGCCCRPDQVPRATLEELAAPDIQLALAELDRENGVVPEPDPSEDLVLVSESRRRRNRERKEERTYEVESAVDADVVANKRRRRRRGGGEGAKAEAEAPKEQKQARRTRRENAAPAEGAEEKPQRTTRRRHHVAEEAAPKEAAADAAPRQGRKPGDKGGQQEERSGQSKRRRRHGSGSAQTESQDQAKPRRERKERPQQKDKPAKEQGAQADAAGKAPKEEGAKPKRRRSRGGRGRKPKQGGEGSDPKPGPQE
jgi:cell fate regulator YaaT (PSP1 superfamily)